MKHLPLGVSIGNKTSSFFLRRPPTVTKQRPTVTTSCVSFDYIEGDDYYDSDMALLSELGGLEAALSCSDLSSEERSAIRERYGKCGHVW
jgi:hypothetical protein